MASANVFLWGGIEVKVWKCLQAMQETTPCSSEILSAGVWEDKKCTVILNTVEHISWLWIMFHFYYLFSIYVNVKPSRYVAVVLYDHLTRSLKIKYSHEYCIEHKKNLIKKNTFTHDIILSVSWIKYSFPFTLKQVLFVSRLITEKNLRWWRWRYFLIPPKTMY